MAKSKKATNFCPECKGTGFITDNPEWPRGDRPAVEQCFNCLGTGFDDDSDTFEAIYRYDDWN